MRPGRLLPLGTCCTAQFSRNQKAIMAEVTKNGIADCYSEIGRPWGFKLGGALLTQQDRWWLAISIVWLFLTLGVLLYLGYA